MRVELADGWIELDGEIVLSSSFSSVDEAEAYVTQAIREKSIEQTMLKFIAKISKSWARKDICEAGDLNNSIWAAILKHRDDPYRWNVRYLKGRAVYAAKQLLRGSSIDLLPYDKDDEIEPVQKSFESLYSLINSLKSEKQRHVLTLTAQGMHPKTIAEELELTVTQVRNAKAKGNVLLRGKIEKMSNEQKADLR
jgi:DNA-binding NarL/FixJ family response regulator